jgi:hypothetical protein
MTPFRVVCGPTTTTHLPTMIHPSLAAADLRLQRGWLPSDCCCRRTPERAIELATQDRLSQLH